VRVGYDSTQRACFVCFLQRVLEPEQGHSTLHFEPSVLKKMPWLLPNYPNLRYACCVWLRAMLALAKDGSNLKVANEGPGLKLKHRSTVPRYETVKVADCRTT
jgi:hypothetical protein